MFLSIVKSETRKNSLVERSKNYRNYYFKKYLLYKKSGLKINYS
jgi:hypothetical protein